MCTDEFRTRAPYYVAAVIAATSAPGASAQEALLAPPGTASNVAVELDAWPTVPAHAPTELSTPRSETWRWQALPEGIVYHTYWASAAEPRLATHLVHEQSTGSQLDSHIGGRVGVVRFGPSSRADGLQLDILGGAKLRQDADRHLEVDSVDFRYDVLLTYGDGPDRYKFGFYHVSAHVADDYLRVNPGHVPLNYLRDALVLGYSYYVTPSARLYAETGYAFNVDVSEPWEFQFGVDYGPSGPTGTRGAPFLAVNGHLREELDFGGNLAMQTGWSWRSDRPGDGTLRTGLYYYNGASPQFSFFRNFEHQIGWGVWYDN